MFVKMSLEILLRCTYYRDILIQPLILTDLLEKSLQAAIGNHRFLLNPAILRKNLKAPTLIDLGCEVSAILRRDRQRGGRNCRDALYPTNFGELRFLVDGASGTTPTPSSGASQAEN